MFCKPVFKIKLEIMKKHKIAILLLLCCSFFMGFAQEKTKKQLRAEKRLEKEREVEKLIDAKEFQFVAQNSNSQTFRFVDLTTNPNFIKFKPDFIKIHHVNAPIGEAKCDTVIEAYYHARNAWKRSAVSIHGWSIHLQFIPDCRNG